MDTDQADSSPPKSGPEGTPATDSIVLEEEIDPNYVPSEEEVIEYAKWLGMDLEKDKDLYWVAREGLMAPLPKNWKPCKTKDTEDIYYFNFSSGESTWDHPCDGYYKSLYEEEKKKKEIAMKERNDQQRSKAKQDVEELLGKGEKKKKKKSVSSLGELSAPSKNLAGGPLGGLAALERKPLPGISMQGNIKPSMLSKSWTEPSINSTNDREKVREEERIKEREEERIKEREQDRIKDKEHQKDNEQHREQHREQERAKDKVNEFEKQEEEYKDTRDTANNSDEHPGSPIRDNSDNKTRRRQRDGSSPMASQEPLVTSRIIRAADASLRAGIEQNRKVNTDDRRGGVSTLHSTVDHLTYRSDYSDSEDEKIGKMSSNSSSSSRHHSFIMQHENERNNGIPTSNLTSNLYLNNPNNIININSININNSNNTSNTSNSNSNSPIEGDRSRDSRDRDHRDSGGVGRESRNRRSRSNSRSGHTNDAVEEFRAYDDDDAKEVHQRISRRSSFNPQEETHTRQRIASIEEAEEKGDRLSDRSADRSAERSVDRVGDRGERGERSLVGSVGSYTGNSSGNNLNDVATARRSQEAKNVRNSSSSSSSPTAEETFSIGEQRDDMQARRRLWQEEVEFHEASVKRQRAAMIKEKEKMDIEQEAIRHAGGGGGGENDLVSPKAANDLRFKLRELEVEMDEVRALNITLEEKLNTAQRSYQREKEVTIQSHNESLKTEEGLMKQLKASRSKGGALEDERNELESEISALKSELKRKSFTESGSRVPHDDASLGEEREKVALLEGAVKDLEDRLSREKASKSSIVQEVEAAEIGYAQQLRGVKAQLKAASDKADAAASALTDSLPAPQEKRTIDLEHEAKVIELKETLEKLEKKSKQMDVMERRLEALGVEIDGMETKRITEKGLSDLRNRQLGDELESMTMAFESGSVKMRRIEQQLKFAEEGAVDKERRWQQSRQALAALQLRCDEGENELFMIKTQGKADSNESHRVIESLEAQLQSVKAAKVMVESLLLSSGDEDDEQHANLIAKLAQSQGDLAAEQANVMQRDITLQGLKQDVVKLQGKVEGIQVLEGTIKGLESELSVCRSQLLENEEKLIALADKMNGSEVSAVGEVSDLKDQLLSVTASNSTLTVQVSSLKEKTRTMDTTIQQLEEKFAEEKRLLKESDLEVYTIRGQVEKEKAKTQLLSQVEGERDEQRRTALELQEKTRQMEIKITKLESKIAASKVPVSMKPSLEGEMTALSQRVEDLQGEISSLGVSNVGLIEKIRVQAAALVALQSKHNLSLLEIDSLSVQLSAHCTDGGDGEGEKLKSLLRQMNAERVQHQNAMNTLQDDLHASKGKVSSLEGDLEERGLFRVAPTIGPSGSSASSGSSDIGIKALTAIVGQQQSSVQRLEEKLESAESLILALSQALPKKNDIAKKQKKVKGRRETGGDTGESEGESERKGIASEFLRHDTAVSPTRVSKEERHEKEEKEVEMESPYWQSSSEDDSEHATNSHTKADRWARTKTQRGEVPAPTRLWSAPPSKPLRQKDRQKEREKAQGVELELEIWALKIVREDRFLGDLTATLKEEKTSVLKEQESLGRRRATWRAKKAQNPKDPASRAELRDTSNELNAQTTRLNGSVEQTRVMRGFLTERRRKLDALKEYLHQLSLAKKEASQPTHPTHRKDPPHKDHEDAELTLEIMDQLGRELDSEVELTLSEFGYSSADSSRPRTSVTPPRVGAYVQPVRYEQRVSSPSQYDRQERQERQERPYQTQQQNQYPPQQQQQQQHRATSTQPYYPSRAQYNDPRTDLFGYENHTNHPQPHSQPHPQPPYMGPDDYTPHDYYPPSSSSPSRMRDDPNRWAQTATSVRFNLGNKGIVADATPYPYDRGVPVRDPRLIRGELKDLTNRRAQSTEAFDTHASWLNNLQAEIGRFSHTTRPDIPCKKPQAQSFSVFMATQGPPLTPEEMLNTATVVEGEKEAYQL